MFIHDDAKPDLFKIRDVSYERPCRICSSIVSTKSFHVFNDNRRIFKNLFSCESPVLPSF